MFERVFDIPYYGLGADERMKPEMALEFFQEAAALHANSIGIGVAGLLERGLTWVLRRYRVNVRRLPGMSAVNVRTWFEPWRNLFSVRAFEARSPSGEAIADAWSAWIVLDLRRGRPTRLDHALPGSYFTAAEPTGEPVTDELPDASGGFGYEASFRSRRRELDLNGHTNHTVYFAWALESVPDEVVAGLSPVTLDAEFLSSVKREDVPVRARKIRDIPLTFSHSIIAAASGALAARIVTVWGASGDAGGQNLR